MIASSLQRALISAAVLTATCVAAQPIPGFELERLRLNPSGTGSLIVATGETLPAGEYRVSLTGDYERNPMVLYLGNTRAGSVVQNKFTAHLAAAFAPVSWLELGLQIPIIAYQGGQDLSFLNVDRPASSGISTPYVNGRFGVLNQYDGDPLDLGIDVGVGLPIGTARALGQERGLTAIPKLALGREFESFRAGLEGGVLLRQSRQVVHLEAELDQEIRSEAVFGITASTLGTGLRGELDVLPAFELGGAKTSVEVLGGVRFPLTSTLELYALVGPGFGQSLGTPLWRLLGGVAFGSKTRSRCEPSRPHTPEACPDLDDDKDGVTNFFDRCPLEPGPDSNEGCPVLDKDGDGIPDKDDACPDVKGVKEYKGCPVPDRDGDGVLDPDDKCPSEPGLKERQGCPVRDADKDGIEDPQDACPEEAGVPELKGCPIRDADNDTVPDHVDNCPKEAGPPDNQGCPLAQKQLVVITREKLVIKDKIYFDHDKATIKKRSFGLLDQIAKIIVEHKEIPNVSVEGHTDDTGVAEYNRKLSQDRADSVKAYLVGKGVEAERLATKGWGPDKPAVEGMTKQAREANRRVEFVIEQDTEPTPAPEGSKAP